MNATVRASTWIALVASALAACGFDDTVLRAGAIAVPLADGGSEVTVGSVVPAAGTAYAIAAGQTFSCAVVLGIAYCWGENAEGALGTGDTDNRPSPAPVKTGVTFASIVVGEGHACGLEQSSGRVLCWGANARGQLGVRDRVSRLEPAPVALPEAATTIGAGYNHTCAILSSKALYCWGDNDEGALGQDDLTPAQHAESAIPLRVGTDSDWIAVSGGQGHTCAIKATGAAYCWGRNTSGELGQGAGAPGQIRRPMPVVGGLSFRSLDVGQDQSCGLAQDGALYCFGGATEGNLDGTESNLLVPTRIGAATWNQVSIDVFSSCAIDAAQHLSCWGRNVEGQLGLGDFDVRRAPTAVDPDVAFEAVSVGRFHICALAADHSIRCTGKNDAGEIGVGDGTRRNRFTSLVFPPVRTR